VEVSEHGCEITRCAFTNQKQLNNEPLMKAQRASHRGCHRKQHLLGCSEGLESSNPFRSSQHQTLTNEQNTNRKMKCRNTRNERRTVKLKCAEVERRREKPREVAGASRSQFSAAFLIFYGFKGSEDFPSLLL